MRSTWSQGWEQVKQNSKEFFLDAHAVSDNFLGRKSYQWMREDKANEETHWERFKEEMMDGSRFYTNDMYLSDRIWLGVGAAAYTIPYLSFRMVFDGAQNSYEYATLRLTGQRRYLFAEANRTPNTYVIGAPVAFFVVAPMLAGEACLRLAGASTYGTQMVKLAGMLAVNTTSRYTSSFIAPFDAKEILAVEEKIKSHPQNSWELLDRISVIPNAVALAELNLSCAIFALGASVETLGRVVGLSNYGRDVLLLANMNSVQKLESFFEPERKPTFSIQEIADQQAKLAILPNTIWEKLDRVALAPRVFGTVEYTLASLAPIVWQVIEASGRTLGASEYGHALYMARHMRAVNNINNLHESKRFPENEILERERTVAVAPITWMDSFDRIALLPRMVGRVELEGVRVLNNLNLIFLEIERRLNIALDGVKAVIGDTEYGAAFWKYQKMHARKILGRYLQHVPTDADIQWQRHELEQLKGMPGYNFLHDIALIPRILAVKLFLAAHAANIVLNGVEATAGILGASRYGADLLLARHMQAVNNLSPYVTPYSENEMKVQERKLLGELKTMMDRFNRVALVPRLLGKAEIASAKVGYVAVRSVDLVAQNMGHVIDGSRRILGMTVYGQNVFDAKHMRAAQLLSRYFPGYSADEMAVLTAKLAVPANTRMESLDRIALVPRLLGSLLRTSALGVKVVMNLTEGSGRLLGISAFTLDRVYAAHMGIINYTLDRYVRPYSAEEMAAQQAKLAVECQSAWDKLDRVGIVLPICAIYTDLAMASALGGTLSAGESMVKLLGVSQKSVDLALMCLSNVGNMYGFAARADYADRKFAFNKPINSWWDGCDLMGAMLTVNSVCMMTTSVASIPPVIGLSKSNWHRFNRFRHEVANDIYERRGDAVVDRSNELYHLAELNKCESTPVGRVVSKYNVLNVAETALMGTVRYVAAPMTYAGIRVVKEHFFGVVPLVNMCARPQKFNLSNPFERIKKRFNDLQNALDAYGHLPLDEHKNGLDMTGIMKIARQAEKRSGSEKMKFGLFSEARKVFSLGHTEEEKVIAEFRSKFDEFARVCKQNKVTNPSNFFNKNITLPRGERFSFEGMLAHVERVATLEQKKRIRHVAQLIRTDIENEMGAMRAADPELANLGESKNQAEARPNLAPLSLSA